MSFHKSVNIDDVSKECRNTVTNVLIDNFIKSDENGYNPPDILEDVGHKVYVSNNALFYERERKSGSIRRCGHMKCSLILYYISQEADFNDWYQDHDVTYTYIGY